MHRARDVCVVSEVGKRGVPPSAAVKLFVKSGLPGGTMDQLLWYLFAGTRGGINRLRLVEVLRDRPYNAHQLAELLDLDYRTIRHHLRILERNGILVNPSGDAYGSLYFLGGRIVDGWATIQAIKQVVEGASARPNRSRRIVSRRAIRREARVPG